MNPTLPETSGELVPRARNRARWIVGLVLLLIGGGTAYAWMRSGLSTARKAFERAEFAVARSAAERYLRIAPNDAEARLIAGNSYFQDDSLNPIEAAETAIGHFSRIPDDSPQGSQARLLQGRAAFLVRQEPSRAVRYLRRSIELDHDQFDAYYLLWQVNNMTERYFEGEPLFREVYRLCPADQRAYRLREWYSSQFTPLSGCSQLDLMMGFREETEVPSEEVALRRLTAFHEYEPHEPDSAAALAQWDLRNQSREAALAVLEAIPDKASARKSPFYLATLIESLIEAGQNDKAAIEFSNWSGSAEGYQYYRIAGLHAQEVQGDLAQASGFYRKAIDTWPGPLDWLLMNRLSRCLALQGEKEESLRVQTEAKRIEGLTDLKVHQKVRAALAKLDDPDGLQEVVQFYASLHRTWEVEAWQTVIAEIEKSRSKSNVFSPFK